MKFLSASVATDYLASGKRAAFVGFHCGLQLEKDVESPHHPIYLLNAPKFAYYLEPVVARTQNFGFPLDRQDPIEIDTTFAPDGHTEVAYETTWKILSTINGWMVRNASGSWNFCYDGYPSLQAAPGRTGPFISAKSFIEVEPNAQCIIPSKLPLKPVQLQFPAFKSDGSMSLFNSLTLEWSADTLYRLFVPGTIEHITHAIVYTESLYPIASMKFSGVVSVMSGDTISVIIQ
jgi:hypothetical protein